MGSTMASLCVQWLALSVTSCSFGLCPPTMQSRHAATTVTLASPPSRWVDMTLDLFKGQQIACEGRSGTS
jgi:hypothetical protein